MSTTKAWFEQITVIGKICGEINNIKSWADAIKKNLQRKSLNEDFTPLATDAFESLRYLLSSVTNTVDEYLQSVKVEERK